MLAPNDDYSLSVSGSNISHFFKISSTGRYRDGLAFKKVLVNCLSASMR